MIAPRRPFARMLAFAFVALSLVASVASAAPSDAPPAVRPWGDDVDSSAKTAREEAKYSFCKDPKPMGPRQLEYCDVARSIEGCEGLVAACDKALKRPEPTHESWLAKLLASLGPFFQALVYVFIFAVIVVVAIPIVNAILRARRDKKLGDDDARENRAVPYDRPVVTAFEVTDAALALKRADEHRARGELDRALGLYLAASLAALDRRGAIRVARHRTNGEYVRGCSEPEARESLREIVREVDRVEFGGAPAESSGLERVASRATSIVRAALVATLALFLFGCNALQGAPGANPTGNELPLDVLKRNGFAVSRLETSLATLPMPAQDKAPSIVLVDLEAVPVEPEAQAHLLRWVENGGILVLFGEPSRWPKELGASLGHASSHDLAIRFPVPDSSSQEPEPEPDDEPVIKDAHVTHADALRWPDATAVAFLDKDVYAALKHVGKGAVVGVAGSELFTNVGIMPRHNPAAFVALVQIAANACGGDAEHEGPLTLQFARGEDGISPPSNPFSALLAAGLGKGLWHALAATILLFLCYGIRHARPRPLPHEARRAFAEHVEATGAFYGRARARAHALAAYGKFVELRLRERVPRGGDPAAFLAARAGVPKDEAEKLYLRATTAKSDDDLRGDELATIKELRAILVKALGAS